MTESCFFGHKYVFSVIIRWIYGKSPAPSGFALSLFCCIIKRNTDNPSIPRNRSGDFPEDRTGGRMMRSLVPCAGMVSREGGIDDT